MAPERSAGLAFRVGLGFDGHRFAPGRPLVLGGVRVPFELGLAGHSDADALTHAVIDALLGATGRGNIGERFPDDDPAYLAADSAALLTGLWRELVADGYRLVNLDTVIVTEKPRLAPYLETMRRRLAGILGLAPEQVSIKPKTAEGLGLADREEGLVAMATVLLTKEADGRG